VNVFWVCPALVRVGVGPVGIASGVWRQVFGQVMVCVAFKEVFAALDYHTVTQLLGCRASAFEDM